MCEFVSFVIGKKNEKVYWGNLNSHAGIEAGWHLKPESYRECEWTMDDSGESLIVRVTDDEDANFYKSSILGRWPTRKDLLKYISEGIGKSNRAKHKYDANGNETSVEYSDGSWAKWEYDANGNRTRYENSGGYWEKREYDANGKMTRYERFDGFWAKREYDANGNEIRYENSKGESK